MDVGSINLGTQLQTGSCDLNATEINDIVPVLIWQLWSFINRPGGLEREMECSLPTMLLPGGRMRPERQSAERAKSTDRRARLWVPIPALVSPTG